MDLNLAETREWLEIVYGDTPGLINICSTDNWAGKTFPARDVEAVLDYIQILDQSYQQPQGIYHRATTLRSKPPEGSRGGDDLSLCLPGLWGDIDIAGPGHKTQNVLPPDVTEAMKIVEASGLPQPSHWIHSGGGLYPWWLLEAPIEITDLEDFRALSAGWQQALSRGAAKLGYHYGSGVGDLSRVLRVPGTVNRKAGLERPCTMLEGHAWSGQLYDEAALFDALATVTPEPPKPSPIQVKMSQGRRDGESPGDEFNRTASWHDILLPHGWQWIRKQGETWYLRRPGKLTGGHSATLRDSTDKLWVFSEEAQPFEAFRLYDKFGAMATLEHNGDFGAAARELGSKGYGAQRSRPPVVLEDSSWATPAIGNVVSMPVSPAAQDTPPVVSAAPAVTRDAQGLPLLSDEFFHSFEWNEPGICEGFAQAHADTLKSVGRDTWMFWDGKRWADDDLLRHELAGTRFATGMIHHAQRVNREDEARGKELLKVANKTSNMLRMIGLARAARSQPELAATMKSFDQDKHLVTCENGILDLKTMQLIPHDPSMMLTKKVNASYVPSATSGRFTRFIEEVLPDPAVRDYFQRALGYALTGEADQRAIFLLHGDSGTGKTQTLEALATVLGDFATSAAGSAFRPRQEGYKGPSEDLHQLKGKRFVIQSELDQGAMLNEGLIKAMTGSDTQNTRELYRPSETWRPEFVAFMATNYLPRVSSSDNAIWKRFKPIKFEQVFIDDSGLPKDRSASNLGVKMAQSEPEVILNWILEGLAKYRERGLEEPEQISRWLTGYRDDTDTVRQFLNEATEDGNIAVGEGLDCGSRELYNAYNAWCLDNHLRPLGSTNFGQRMESNGWVRGKTNKGRRWFKLALTGFLIQAQTPVAGRRDWRQRE